MGAKKGAKQNQWCVYKQKDMGELHEKNEVRFELPPIGSYVVVRVRHTYLRGYGKNGDVRGAYVLDDNCLDAMGRALVYKVIDYKLGIDKPLDRGNAVYLEATTRSGYVYKKWLDTLRISIGYYYLELRPDSRQVYESKDYYDCNSMDCPVAEYISTKRKRDAQGK